MIEWILSDELKEFMKTELLKGVEKYKENPNAKHEYLKYRDISQPQRRERKMGRVKGD